MKKILSLMLGLSLVTGPVAFSQEKTVKHTGTHSTKSTKGTKGTKSTRKRSEKMTSAGAR
jgi:hypothetical protein